jgi:nucleotide-binding universal stress UspA family protein
MVDDTLHQENDSAESHSRQHRRDTNRFMLRRAQRLSEKWGKRLDHFDLPCPLCKGELKFQGVYHDHLYEFAEGEPGVVNELDVLPISFVCDHCGYTAEFDADLFNPAFLAKLQGADPERVNELAVRDFCVLISLTGKEESDTLLELATGMAEVQGGTALVFSTARDEAEESMLRERLQHYRPQAGAPAPVRLAQHKFTNLAEELAEVVEREACDLLMIDVRDGLGYSQTAAGDTIKRVLNKSLCDVVLVHNRGLQQNVRRILLATAGGPNAQTAAQMAVNLACAFNAEIHFFNAASPNDPDAKANGQARISETLHEVLIPDNVRLRTHVVVSSDPVQAIVEEATNFDLLVMGDSPRDWRGKIPLDSISAKVARNCSSTALIVLGRHSQIQSWIDRLFG